MYKHLTALGLCVGVGLLLTAWANQAASPAAARIMLMGEVHDNPDGHRQRTDALRGAVEAGFRPALLMEQLNQAALTQAQAHCSDADCVIAAASGKRWEWPLYKPVIELALRYRLPLIAANVSRADAGKVVGGGLTAALDPATIRQFKFDQAKNAWAGGHVSLPWLLSGSNGLTCAMFVLFLFHPFPTRAAGSAAT